MLPLDFVPFQPVRRKTPMTAALKGQGLAAAGSGGGGVSSDRCGLSHDGETSRIE
jgi:hypothetical protein